MQWNDMFDLPLQSQSIESIFPWQLAKTGTISLTDFAEALSKQLLDSCLQLLQLLRLQARGLREAFGRRCWKQTCRAILREPNKNASWHAHWVSQLGYVFLLVLEGHVAQELGKVFWCVFGPVLYLLTEYTVPPGCTLYCMWSTYWQ